MVLSLLFFGTEVYFLNLKSLILLVPGARQSSSWEGVLGISVYLAHLSLIWYYGFPAYRTLFHSAQRQGAYVWSQFQFNLPILFPWVLVTALTDVLDRLARCQSQGFPGAPAGRDFLYSGFFAFHVHIFALSDQGLVAVSTHSRESDKGRNQPFLPGAGSPLSGDTALAGF